MVTITSSIQLLIQIAFSMLRQTQIIAALVVIILLQNVYYINKDYFKRSFMRSDNLPAGHRIYGDSVNLRQLQGRAAYHSDGWMNLTFDDVTVRDSSRNSIQNESQQFRTLIYQPDRAELGPIRLSPSPTPSSPSSAVSSSQTPPLITHPQPSSDIYFHRKNGTQNFLNNASQRQHNVLPSQQETWSLFSRENVPFYVYQLNATLAQDMPLLFDVPDTRPSACASQKYLSPPYREKVSIIVPFHNELWINLVRLIYSIIQRTPPDLLQEIILLDDASGGYNLQQPLEQFISLIPKAKLHRLKQREGLIRARVFGAQIATGDELVFLDAHVICNENWLQPLLATIRESVGTVAIPIVDTIEPYTLKYLPVLSWARGSFNWEMEFVWTEMDLLPDQEHIPYDTASMIGCAFAVHRDFFLSHGSLDMGMAIWGGENIELIMRTWMCGGSAKIVPCSFIGHIFRPKLPYIFPRDVIHKNSQRVVDVWLDDYAQYFYQITNKKLEMTVFERESLEERKRLRQDLKCKSFQWFLDHVAPELVAPFPDSVLFGQVKHVSGHWCLEVNSDEYLVFNKCTKLRKGYQQFSFNNRQQFMDVHTKMCLVPEQNDIQNFTPIRAVLCNVDKHNSLWFYQPLRKGNSEYNMYGVDQFKTVLTMQIHGNSTRCLSAITGKDGLLYIGLTPCSDDSPSQHWLWSHRINGTYTGA